MLEYHIFSILVILEKMCTNRISSNPECIIELCFSMHMRNLLLIPVYKRWKQAAALLRKITDCDGYFSQLITAIFS